MNINDFKFFHPIEVRWNDLDPIGHVNNIYYFEYFQIGRGHYMNEISSKWDWLQHMFVIAHMECDYMKEIKLTDPQLKIAMRIDRMGQKSFDFEYILVSQKEGQEPLIHARGKSTQVLIDLKLGKSIEIPSWLRDDITKFEGII